MSKRIKEHNRSLPISLSELQKSEEDSSCASLKHLPCLADAHSPSGKLAFREPSDVITKNPFVNINGGSECTHSLFVL